MDSHRNEQRRLLSTPEAAARLGLGVSSLEKDRLTGQLGIPFLKLGKRRVLYDPTALDEYLAACRRTSTSDLERERL